MSRAKEASDNWALLAEREGYRCERCGERIPYEERETYFKTTLCAWCLNQVQKDD